MTDVSLIRLELVPTSVPDWEQTDASLGPMRGGPQLASDKQLRDVLGSVRFSLPAKIETEPLAGYVTNGATSSTHSLPADVADHRYTLIGCPVTILVPAPQRLVRLRLSLGLETTPRSQPAVAYDIFPTNQWRTNTVDIGEASLDISKALQFVCPAPLAGMLGLRLSIPLRWSTDTAEILTSNRMSNPVEWYVTDEKIANGFIGYSIVRAPKEATVRVHATLVGELRFRGPASILKGRFRAASPISYELPSG
jgi:hypothetical protein